MSRLLCRSLTILVLGLALTGGVWGDSWFNSSWGYRQDISIAASGAGGAVANFPVMVHLSQVNDPNLWTYAKGNFYDLVFTANDGTTVLPYEIESSSTTDL